MYDSCRLWATTIEWHFLISSSDLGCDLLLKNSICYLVVVRNVLYSILDKKNYEVLG